MASVYIETSVPSYYFETRRSPAAQAWREATRKWWSHCRRGYELFTSRFALAELRRAPRAKARAALSLLRNVTVLNEPRELQEVANYYIEQRAMPAVAGGDAYHLAMASLHKMDFLLTWNCQHLANANKVRHLAVLNARLGLPMPVITTPLTLIPEDQS